MAPRSSSRSGLLARRVRRNPRPRKRGAGPGSRVRDLTGRFVRRSEAKRRPRSTVVERLRHRS